ncbi:alpha-(1-_3)-arabinofuranosyltransferase [Nocardioides sp.]|uniref:alpha-(1->3)-arabinofuranosyltransferase n=1 Tax=Nocardioides sp. TaxID=35761 RepID=UPI0031FE8AF2|nr:aftD [Nocardioides sp.]
MTRSPSFALRLLAGCVLLVGLAVVQDPGLLVSDTKLDLALGPADFLGRALHLWDGRAALGELQNQAYGYLWPMGSFFLLGWVAQVPGWVVQRLWQGLVMSVAFAGTARLSRALGVRSDLACLVAGFAFALSPRMLSTLGSISIEAWPGAVAPWVLLPLVRGATAGSPRRAAALSGLAVAMVGGVNAAATFAVLPMGAIWLLTRTSGPRRRSLMLWWPVFTALGTLWWLVPLFVMGSYSPPFLDYIETGAVTTFPTTLFDALRGTSDWVAYVDSGARAGRDLISTPYLVLNSGVVLLAGFAGLLDRRNPHRLFLSLSLLVGVLMVTFGHVGAVQGWFGGSSRDLLDGALSPMRNVHKFDPIIRLPLVLGLAFALERVVDLRRSRAGSTRLGTVNRLAVLAMIVLPVAGAALPAIEGRIEPAGATLGVPGYWQQTATWLGDQPEGTALLVPGAAFGDYVWGTPRDEPMQAFARSPWATRNVIPLTPPGNIRMLDAIESRLAQGEGSAGLTAYLRRAGVRYLVVRNDLAPGDDVPVPFVVHEAIAESPGLSLAASFGPTVGGKAHLDTEGGRLLVNAGWQASYAAVEVFEVDPDSGTSSASPPVVAGGPEDLLDLLDLGVIGDGPAVLAADATSGLVGAGGPGGQLVLTDGLRQRERSFPRIHDGYSAATTPGDVRRTTNPASDYLIDDAARWSTTVRLDGVAAISASSSASDADSLGGARRGELPYAALDGSPETAWVSGAGKSGRAWWQVDLDTPTVVDHVVLTAGSAAAEDQLVRVRTANGVSDPVELAPGDRRVVALPAGDPTDWLRVEDGSLDAGGRLALAEVSVEGVSARRALVLPTLPESWGTPDQIVLRADRDARTGCASVLLRVRCQQSYEVPSEEPLGMRRVVPMSAPASYLPEIRVAPRAGPLLDQLLLREQPVSISASSTGVPDPRASAVAAIDGDPGTTWLAAADETQPSLDVRWLGKRTVTGLQLRVNRNTAARAPTDVVLEWPGGRREVTLQDGSATFAPIRTDQLRIDVLEAEPVSSLDFASQSSPVAVGVTELRLSGVPYLPLGLSADDVTYPCGTGPEVTVDGRTYETSVTGSPLDLARGLLADASLCGSAATSGRPASPGSAVPVALAAGENEIATDAGDAFTVASVVLVQRDDTVGAPTPVVEDSAGLERTGPETRTITPAPGDTLVSMRENANAGWSATQDGHVLAPVVVDGWQQGWLLRNDQDPVHADFGPDGAYRLGLGVGLALAVLLVGLLVVMSRRWGGPIPAPLTTRGLSVRTLLPVALGMAGLVAGWTGVSIGLAAAVAAFVLARRAPAEAPWVLGALCLVASLAYVATPWGSASGWAGNASWPHYLVLVPLVAAVTTAGSGTERRPSPLRRRAGRSIRR